MEKESSTAPNASQSFEPSVLIQYRPPEVPTILGDNAAKMIVRIRAVKPPENLRDMRQLSEVLDRAKTTAGDVERFVENLRDAIHTACDRVRALENFEDFEATLTIRRWSTRTVLNSGIEKLRQMRAKFLADEEEKTRREQSKREAEQAEINRKAAEKAAAEAKKAGADKTTQEQIKQEVMETPAPIVTSKVAEAASAAKISVQYEYVPVVTSLKDFLVFCLKTPPMMATLTTAIPWIEKAFGPMCKSQKEQFRYPGITFNKRPIDVDRGRAR